MLGRFYGAIAAGNCWCKLSDTTQREPSGPDKLLARALAHCSRPAARVRSRESLLVDFLVSGHHNGAIVAAFPPPEPSCRRMKSSLANSRIEYSV
jgi:hypothetical protein